MMDGPRLVAVLGFPVPIPLPVDALGTVWDVTLGERQCKLHLPILEGEEPSGSLSPPPVDPRGLVVDRTFVSAVPEDHPLFWGVHRAAVQGVSPSLARIGGAVFVAPALAGADDMGHVDEAHTVRHALHGWLTRFVEWLEVLAGLDLRHDEGAPPFLQAETLGQSDDLVPNHWRLLRADGSSRSFFVAGAMGFLVRDDLATLDDLRDAIWLTNVQQVPPVEHVLLRDALVAFRTRRWRRVYSTLRPQSMWSLPVRSKNG